MDDANNSEPDRSPMVDKILAEYLRRVDAGEAVDREAFLRAYPEAADALRSYFDGADLVERLAGGARDEANDASGAMGGATDEANGGRRPHVAAWQSLGSAETIAPRGLSDSWEMPTGPFGQLPAAFGRYRVEKAIGRGAMGSVYLARDTQLDRPVALKVPRLSGHEEQDVLDRFLREARAAANLTHPNICRVFDVGSEAGVWFIAMEFVEGRPLAEFIVPGHLHEEKRCANVVRKLAQALDEAHTKGIIHRDLKPANILINQRGEPILMDFGLARLADSSRDGRATRSGMILGSPAYMSPEQANGETDKIGPQSDIYSLGVLLFELLTCQLPFQGSVLTILSQIATKEPPLPSSLRPGLDLRLEAICLRMMAKQPAHRFRSMSEVERELTQWLASAPAVAPSTTSASGGRESPGPVVVFESLPDRGADTPRQPTPAASAKDSLGGLQPVPDKSVKAKKSDIVTADDVAKQKQQVIKLLGEHNVAAALPLLEKLAKQTAAVFKDAAAWAKSELPLVRERHRKQQEQNAAACTKARTLLDKHDYSGAASLLDQIPAAARTAETTQLLSKASELYDECQGLLTEIEEAIRRKKYDRLQPIIKRYLKLKPDSPKLERLHDDLDRNRPDRAVAKFKNARKYFDVVGRLVEPKEVALTIFAILGLFFAVSYSVRFYLANRTPTANSGSPQASVVAGPPTNPGAVTPSSTQPSTTTDLGPIPPPAKLWYESNDADVQEAASQAKTGNVGGAIRLLEEKLAKSQNDRGSLQVVIQLLQHRATFQIQRRDRSSAVKSFVESASYARRLRQAYNDLNQAEQMLIASALYNGACGQALSGEKDNAVTTLKEAKEAGWSNWKWAAEDDDLKTLRELPEFRSLLYSPTADGGSLQLLLDLDFSKSHGGFVVNEPDYLKMAHLNGEWQYMAKKPGIWYWTPQPGLTDARLSEFVFEAETRIVDPQPGGWFLRFSDVPGKSNVDFHVRHDGRVGVYETFGPGTEKWLIPLTPAPAMRAPTEPNTARLEVINGTIKISVNGQEVAQAQESRVTESGLLLFSSADQPPVDVRFRRIRLWKPDTSTQLRADASGLTIVEDDRQLWEYQNAAGQPGAFQKTSSGWIERGRDVEFRFREATRNSQFVELWDDQRGIGARLFADRCELFFRSAPQQSWKRYYAGKWTKPSAKRAIPATPITAQPALAVANAADIPKAGLVLHVDPSKVGQVVSQGAAVVQSASDQSGRGNHLAPRGAGNNVVLTANAINGLSAFTFNNGQSLGPASSSDFANTRLSMFVVVHPTSFDAWNFIIGKDTYSWGPGYGIEIRSGDLGAYAAGGGPQERYAKVAPNKTYVLSAVKDDSSMRLWVDGTLRTTHRSFTGFNPAAQQYRVGNSDNKQQSWGLTGHIGEILHYNRALSDAERQAVETYLISKWRSQSTSQSPSVAATPVQPPPKGGTDGPPAPTKEAGFVQLFDGTNFNNQKWRVGGRGLGGKVNAGWTSLTAEVETTDEYRHFELQMVCRLPKNAKVQLNFGKFGYVYWQEGNANCGFDSAKFKLGLGGAQYNADQWDTWRIVVLEDGLKVYNKNGQIAGPGRLPAGIVSGRIQLTISDVPVDLADIRIKRLK